MLSLLSTVAIGFSYWFLFFNGVLSHWDSYALLSKTAKWIEVLFGVKALGGSRNIVLVSEQRFNVPLDTYRSFRRQFLQAKLY